MQSFWAGEKTALLVGGQYLQTKNLQISLIFFMAATVASSRVGDLSFLSNNMK